MIQKETIRLYSRVALRLGMMWCLQALINDAFAAQSVTDADLKNVSSKLEDMGKVVTGIIGQLAFLVSMLVAGARAGMSGNVGMAASCGATAVAGVMGMRWVKTSLTAVLLG